MKNKIIIGFLIIISISVVIDICVRLYYYSGLYLEFNSTEFNNIVSPIVSIFGFIGIIITILISSKQFKSSISEKYLSQYNEYLKGVYGEIQKEGSNDLFYKKYELLAFFSPVRLKYDKLIEDENYKNQIGASTLGENTYENTLSPLRVFNIQALMLYKELLNTLKEIIENRQMISNHKEILLSSLIGDIVSYYIASCEIIKIYHPQMIDDLFVGIDKKPDDTINIHYFFNDSFFELYEFVMSDEELKKYYK